ncbi:MULTISPECIES: hypothetical protein [unclassified Crossiella]|uniref:hypothetical protein n=1 Tax=unclassified Crossiella TaxID=2620835 RepID=UPI001FFF7109|nr:MULTISPECIES: hypothetical protein [unclassified Crossiella]MCK2237153.1 hypothetical protein [Crossiella sp. S99.2]MCK2250821.1 hypothetical protein [Crossiella sp. S99.1]
MDNMPSWMDTKLGGMKRVALWLIQVIGLGNTFTKNQLREAFPEVAQIDRRLRDLRDFDWKIHTNREDVGLGTHEQRLVEVGQPVWVPGKATRRAAVTVTAAQRHEALMRDGHKCRSCGIGPGEAYVGTDVTSQLDVARRDVLLPDGTTKTQLVIECNRCRIGNRELVANLGRLLGRINKLPAIEKKILSAWVAEDRRGFSEIEDIWAGYRTLPAESRVHVRDALA